MCPDKINRIDASTETVATIKQGLGKTESPVESGVDPLLVVDSKNSSYEPNKGAIGKMEDFFNQPGFGSDVISITKKSPKVYDGQRVFDVTKRYGSALKKGDQVYLDGQHKNHLEVFDKQGNFKAVLNLDGTLNIAKTAQAKKTGRRPPK
ncbi:hypothetical protein RND59_00765 [Vibrio ruber]|uniref:hypothetical protein n=1 Tax=Vibrio ruber TaxID=184755 RepID=UPI0028936FFB|nr:hypothetical protein [Vibrio ruber]WNJ95688.1 hypothetical protein RND59_00765 [Vibrio ruber]